MAAKLRTKSDPDASVARCTDLLARFARTRSKRGFDEFAALATPFLRRRAQLEIARCQATIDEPEVVQEALLNVFRYAHTFRPQVPHAFATWGARVVRNVVLRCLRKRRRVPTVSFDEMEGVDLPDRATPEPIRHLVDDEARRELASSFSLYLQVYFGSYLGLTDLQRRVLHKVEILGHNYRRVAADLGMRVEAVKMVVYRGRKRIHSDIERAAAG